MRGYLEEAGRDPSTPGWLFRQWVHALQILHSEVIGAEWSRTFDWKYWLDSAQELESRHPPLARHNQPIASRRSPSGRIESTECSIDNIEHDLVAKVRLKNYSIRTEEAYVGWLRRFASFNQGQDPRLLGTAELAAYLNYLALDREIAVSTQSQALSALVFLYEQVMGKQGIDRRPCRRAQAAPRARRASAAAVPCSAGHTQVQSALRLHTEDLAQGYGEVFMPDSLARKYPNAPREPCWQYVFPSGRLSVDLRAAKVRRHHRPPSRPHP